MLSSNSNSFPGNDKHLIAQEKIRWIAEKAVASNLQNLQRIKDTSKFQDTIFSPGLHATFRHSIYRRCESLPTSLVNY